jgi:hypothetical protein
MKGKYATFFTILKNLEPWQGAGLVEFTTLKYNNCFCPGNSLRQILPGQGGVGWSGGGGEGIEDPVIVNGFLNDLEKETHRFL